MAVRHPVACNSTCGHLCLHGTELFQLLCTDYIFISGKRFQHWRTDGHILCANTMAILSIS